MAFNMTDDLRETFEEKALEVSKPFCYGCYQVVEEGSCPTCASDDFMRFIDGVGCEYGTYWIIEHLIVTEGDPIDENEEYLQLLDEYYTEEIDICGLKFNPGYALQQLDPIAFDMGKQEWFDLELSEGRLVEVNGVYYRHDLID